MTQKKKILVWFEIFEKVIQNNDMRKIVENAFSVHDIIYTHQESLQSAAEWTYMSKIHVMPTYVNNDEAVHEYAKEKEEGVDCEITTPAEFFEELTGTNVQDLSLIHI